MKLQHTKRPIEHEPLAKYTSWRIGGPARYFAEVHTPEALCDMLDWAGQQDIATFVLGGGTNLLVSDQGFAGLVLRYRASDLRVTETDSGAQVWVAAGAPMAGTARRLAGQGWGGLEWAEGLPGTIGGALFGNAGCYGGDIASVLTRAWLLIEGEVVEWQAEQFAYGYRTSRLKELSGDTGQPHRIGPIVLAAECSLRRADQRELATKMEQTAAARRGKTPAGQSCGSVFKNPPGDSAGRLIEAAGLKGTRIGGAEIAQKHANYIINCGGASSDDVLKLAMLAREQVFKQFGVALELEIQVVGAPTIGQ